MADIPDSRAEEQALLQGVQAGQRDPAMVALVKLLELRLRKQQARLVDCQPEEFVVLQAEARATKKLLSELKPK